MEDKKEWLVQWKYWAQCSVKIINEFAPYLKISDQEFSTYSNHALILSNPKGFFLYGILDEVAKIGTAMFRWIAFISGDKEVDPRSFPARMVIQAVFDEQQLWGRKMLEALTDLILFEDTNEENYFKHYLLLKELEHLNSSQKDWIEFYGKSSSSLEFQRKLWIQRITQLESSLILSNCWYLKTKSNLNAYSKNTNIFESFRQKLIKAMPKATAREKLIFGFTYSNYSYLSGFMHFSTDKEKHALDESEIETTMWRIWFTIICIIRRIQKSIGVEPQGFNDELNTLINLNTNADELVAQITGDYYSVNDIVRTHNNELCMIEDISTSKYGYKLFKLNYLQHKERLEPFDEWVPGNHIYLVYKYSDHKKAIERDPSVVEYLKSVPEEEYLIHYANYFLRLWNHGMKNYFLKGDKQALLNAFINDSRKHR